MSKDHHFQPVIRDTYSKGRFDILTLSGSYVRTEIGGRTGGLSVCLASTDGQIIGGGVGGPLIAGGPIQAFVRWLILLIKVWVEVSLLIQSRGMQPTPLHSTGLRVSTVQGLHQSPENGDYDHLQD
ncbi:hypothetical protein HAX54_025328 [Datura stramonium]|uniref:AT-hook motif nuclear-localized protein n=1 Tax=Datura stramonium TaxID=4076 RepID=A0ABS8UZD1_DATST|nr:hypothetical protein [Datura stramonium]